jgi:hypothetical protein
MAMGDLVRVEGTRDVLAQLVEFTGFSLIDFTDEDLGAGQYSVLGYATAAAAADLTGMGASVTVLQPQADVEAGQNLVASSIDDSRNIGLA